jgi:ankyrin repeat protein
LAYLIHSGHAEDVRKLIKKSPKLREAHGAGEDGLTPLCLATGLGQLNIVRMLASAGCDTNTPSGNGTTPLMCAAEQGDVKMIVTLCRLAAKPVLTNPKTGWNALTYALVNKHLDACKVLITEGADLCQILDISDSEGGQSIAQTRLVLAILLDFVELID